MLFYPDRPASPREALPTKLILSVFQAVVCVFWWLSIIEHLKALAIFLSSRGAVGDQEKHLAARSIAIDLYEILKWLALASFFVLGSASPLAVAVTAYLLASNLFSHFYYHIWRDSPAAIITHQQMQRRLTSFVLAFAFAILAFGFVYYSIPSQISWPDNEVSIVNALYLSVANTFTLTYGDAGPASGDARALFVSQVVYAFVFVVMIIAKSLPSQN